MKHNQSLVAKVNALSGVVEADDLTALDIAVNYSPTGLNIDAVEESKNIESFITNANCFFINPFSYLNNSEERFITPSECLGLLAGIVDDESGESAFLLLLEAQDLKQLSEMSKNLYSLLSLPSLKQVSEASMFMADIQQEKRLTNVTATAANEVDFYSLVNGVEELKGGLSSLASFSEVEPLKELKEFAEDRKQYFSSLASTVSEGSGLQIAGLTKHRFNSDDESLSNKLSGYGAGLPQTPFSVALLFVAAVDVVDNIEALIDA